MVSFAARLLYTRCQKATEVQPKVMMGSKKGTVNAINTPWSLSKAATSKERVPIRLSEGMMKAAAGNPSMPVFVE